MTRTLYTGGLVYSPGEPPAEAILVDGDTITWVGRDEPPGAVDHVVRLDGALVTPSFVDTHVHTTATGLALDGLDLTGCPSLAEALRQVAAYAQGHPPGIMIGHGWDESSWPERRPPTAAELDAATGAATCYLSRTDAHSAVVSSDLLALTHGLPGFDRSGHVRLEAHHEIRRGVFAGLDPDQRRRAQRRALTEAARRGLGCVHENATPVLSSEEDLGGLLELSRTEPLPEVIGYWGELHALDMARRHGLPGLAGDLLADGSIGSHTACLMSPYADADTEGHAYLSAGQVAEHVVECTRNGLQAGFHAIGDGALANVLHGFEQAAATVGIESIRAAHHRLEHLEMLDTEMIDVMARLGILASVQPIADHFWGGPGGMYAQRLGAERARAMNPFRQLVDAGVPLALSSDSPIMPLGPWRAIRAAVNHNVPEQRLDVATAVHAHTVGGWRAAGRDDGRTGRLLAGGPASLAIWDCGDALDPATMLPDMSPDAPDPTCLRTVVKGQTVHDLMEN